VIAVRTEGGGDSHRRRHAAAHSVSLQRDAPAGQRAIHQHAAWLTFSRPCSAALPARHLRLHPFIFPCSAFDLCSNKRLNQQRGRKCLNRARARTAIAPALAHTLTPACTQFFRSCCHLPDPVCWEPTGWRCHDGHARPRRRRRRPLGREGGREGFPKFWVTHSDGKMGKRRERRRSRRSSMR
jgi:hypothetical protein